MIYWPDTRFSNDFVAVVVKTSRPPSATAHPRPGSGVDPMEALKAE
jgi:hypothetical protein